VCGRFTDRYSWRELKELYDITTPYLESNFPPRYNIAPTQNSFVVRLDKQGGRELVEMKWGLVPSWSERRQDAGPHDQRQGGIRERQAGVSRRL
jgi:putative SOS response-associated peptidase YedK